MEPTDISFNIFYTIRKVKLYATVCVLFIEFIFSLLFVTMYLNAKSDWVGPSQDFGLRAFEMMIVCFACTVMSQTIAGPTQL
jgi:hypothetical protein